MTKKERNLSVTQKEGIPSVQKSSTKTHLSTKYQQTLGGILVGLLVTVVWITIEPEQPHLAIIAGIDVAHKVAHWGKNDQGDPPNTGGCPT